MKKYQEVTPISRTDAQLVFAQCRTEEIPFTLVRLAYFDPDWKWVQDISIAFSTHPDKWVRRMCVICFSHLARIHGKLEKEKIMPVLHRLLQDPEVKGDVEDTLDELKIFLKE